MTRCNIGNTFYHFWKLKYISSYWKDNSPIIGKWLYVGNDYWPFVGGRAAIISPPIINMSLLCSAVFFYRLGRQGRAGLSLYIQTGVSAALVHFLFSLVIIIVRTVLNFFLQSPKPKCCFPNQMHSKPEMIFQVAFCSFFSSYLTTRFTVTDIFSSLNLCN